MTDSGSPITQHLALLSGIPGLDFNKTGGSIVTNQTATVGSGNNLIINNFDIPSAFTFEVSNGDVLELSGGAYIDAGTLQLDSGSTTQVDGGSTIVVDGGTFLTTGTNDNPPNPATKALVTWDGSTPWDFNASSGTVDLTGFIFDNMDDNGIQITGTTNLAHFDGGQLTNLSADYTTMIPLNLSTSGSIPGTSTNFGWNWGPNNTPPGNAVAYVLAESSDCAGQTITFMSWFGDFYSNSLPDPQTKVSASDCTINISAADTVVPLTEFIATSNGNSITLTWQTGDTKTFKGFNVLRSLNALANYTQINQSLVQPIIDPSTPHGKYLFTDSNIQNNFNYFYKIQGITPNNKILEFGPVQADKKSAIVFP